MPPPNKLGYDFTESDFILILIHRNFLLIKKSGPNCLVLINSVVDGFFLAFYDRSKAFYSVFKYFNYKQFPPFHDRFRPFLSVIAFINGHKCFITSIERLRNAIDSLERLHCSKR